MATMTARRGQGVTARASGETARPVRDPASAIALTVDVDGLAQLYAFRGWTPPMPGCVDETYRSALPRLAELLAELGVSATFFVVGLDLARAEPARRVAWLASQGHEIANHSHSHRLLVGLGRREVAREIAESHDRIAQTVGQAPVGFRAPGWCASPFAQELLLAQGYRYDASTFPSPLAGLASTYVALRAGHSRDAGAALASPSWRGPRRARRLASGLVDLPTLTATPARLPVWGSVYLGLGRDELAPLIASAARRCVPAAWVMHDWELLDFERLGDSRFGYKPGSRRPVAVRAAAVRRVLDSLASTCSLARADAVAQAIAGRDGP